MTRRQLGRMAGVAISVLLVALTILVGWGRSYLTVASPLRKSVAIVLLAGSYEERAPMAASLYHAGYAPRIILANDGVRRGWSREHQRNLYAIERSEIELVKLGVPRQAIVRLPFRKSGTVYDALAVKEYLTGELLPSIILVTSDYHTRRALWITKRVLRHLPVTVSIVASHSGQLLLPKIANEIIKLPYYYVRYGLLADPAEL